MTKPPKPYSVGYGKPPAHTRFKPGQSGNPKGRAKGSASIREVIAAELSKLVKVQQGDAITHLSKKQAIVRKLIEVALKGELQAARLLLSYSVEFDMAQENTSEPDLPLTSEELAVLESLVKEAPGGKP
jgi:hypothetical protein